MNSFDAGTCNYFLRQKLLLSIDMHMLSGLPICCQFQTLSYFFVMLLTLIGCFLTNTALPETHTECTGDDLTDRT